MHSLPSGGPTLPVGAPPGPSLDCHLDGSSEHAPATPSGGSHDWPQTMPVRDGRCGLLPSANKIAYMGGEVHVLASLAGRPGTKFGLEGSQCRPSDTVSILSKLVS